jgi:hypothetical protein
LKQRQVAASRPTSLEKGAGGEAPASPVVNNLYEAIRARIDPLGGVELEIPRREPMPPPIDFS